MRPWIFVGAVLTGMFLTGSVFADELSDLKNQVTAQEKQMGQLKKQIGQLEAQQAKAEKKPAVVPDSLKWAENINLFGDLRFRNSYIDDEYKSADQARIRNQIRLRVGANAKVADEFDVGLRLASGENREPVGANQTLGEAWGDKYIWLDQAFAGYHPKTVKGFDIWGGKVVNPFYCPGKTEFIWDNDLNPEGVSAQYKTAFKKTKVSINGGAFWVIERELDVDSGFFGLQGVVEQPIRGSSSLIAGASYYDYTHLQGIGNLRSVWDPTKSSFFGNSSTGGVYANDYNLLEFFAEFASKVKDWPVSVFGSFVQNIGVEDGYNEDTGWTLGGTFNKLSNPGTWEARYEYRDLGKDSVVGQYCDSDFAGGGSGVKGHKATFTYQVAKNTTAVLSLFSNTQTSRATDTDYTRATLDLVLKFK